MRLSFCVCQTGVVQVNRPLDRERVAEYRLTITVKDNPENPRIARRVTSLTVHTQCHIESSDCKSLPLRWKTKL